MDFSAAELKRLLCRKPYNCGPQSNSLPEELFQHGRFQRDHLMIMRENYHGVAILSRCSGCDKLAVRRLNMIHPECKAFIDLSGMCEVPGVGVQQGKGLRRNLFADAFLYPHQCLGVDSMKEVVLLGGMPSVDDMNRGFPLEETAEEEEEDPDPETPHGAVINQRQTALPFSLPTMEPSLSPSEVKRLLCRKPYNCGPQSDVVPDTLFQLMFQLGISRNLEIMKEAYTGAVLLSRCSGCDKLAVRRLNISVPDWQVIIHKTGMCEVPGVSVQPSIGRRSNLLVDAIRYTAARLGVNSPDDIKILGEEVMTDVEDANRSFPIEETETIEEDTAADLDSETPNKCAQCGTVEGRLHECTGACDGAVSYCSKDCQRKHWKDTHKKECWKVAKCNTFSIKTEDGLVLPLRALHSRDGFRRSCCSIYYSNHMGEAVSKLASEQLFGAWDSEAFETQMYCFMTNPVHNDEDRALLKLGEACFNISDYPEEFQLLEKLGIITPTNRTLQMGDYPNRRPVCRVNLPFYVPEGEEFG